MRRWSIQTIICFVTSIVMGGEEMRVMGFKSRILCEDKTDGAQRGGARYRSTEWADNDSEIITTKKYDWI